MSTQTTNLGLTKPAGNERPLVSVLNDNMDIIDDAVGAVDVVQDGSLQEQVTTLKADMIPSEWTIVPSSGYPSGVSGTIRYCVVGKIAFVQFDGFKLSSASWQTVATGLPKAITYSAWFTMATDSSQNVKAQISTSGVLQVRLNSTGTNVNVDVMVSYPCQ